MDFNIVAFLVGAAAIAGAVYLIRKAKARRKAQKPDGSYNDHKPTKPGPQR